MNNSNATQVASLDQTPRPSSAESIAADQILLVHKNIPGVLFATALATVPIAIIMWNSGQREAVVFWVLLQVAVIIVRAGHHYSFKPDEATTERVFQYGRSGLWMVGLAGGGWGLAGVLFFDPQLTSGYSYVILTLVCMISGSMSAISSAPHVYNVFACLTMLPFIITMAILGSGVYTVMSIVAPLYLGINIVFSRNLRSAVKESLTLKYQNMELVENLQIQTEFANKANEDKSRFLAAASHDIRQPLHAANLFVDAMELEVNNDRQRYVLGGIRRGMDSVSELFDSLLDISSIDTKITPVSKSDFNLGELMAHLDTALQIEAQQKNIELNFFDCDYRIHTDHVLLERILSNLIVNAVNYTYKGRVEVFCKRVGADKVEVHIKDTGIGIKLEDQESVFKEFYQINNAERDRSKGLGLGLAIVNRLTALLEISMSLTSKIDQGTEFTLELDLSTSQEQLQSPTQTTFHSSKLDGLLVLVVDNEADIIEGLTLVLTNWGCDVLNAGSSEEAIEQVLQNKPDFVISDFRMPGKMDGIDLINEIRVIDADINGIIISGDTGQGIIKKSQDHEVILLKKPVKPVQLNMAINRLIKN